MRFRSNNGRAHRFSVADFVGHSEPLKRQKIVDEVVMILEKFDLQRRLMREPGIDLSERMNIILKLSKIAIIWPKYEHLIQKDLDDEFKSKILNRFLMPGGMGMSFSGIYLMGMRADWIGYMVSLCGVSLIIVSLLKRTIVSDLSEMQVANRMQKYILEESINK